MSLDRVSVRLRKKVRIRKVVFGTSLRPRLTVFRSLKHIYAQVVDDVTSRTLVSASSLSRGNGGNIEGARLLGALLADRAVRVGVVDVVFDRNGYKYHGRVKALADAAREAGLKF